MANPDPYLRSLYEAHAAVMRETRSTAKRVPRDYRERVGYRQGLREAARILAELAEAREAVNAYHHD